MNLYFTYVLLHHKFRKWLKNENLKISTFYINLFLKLLQFAQSNFHRIADHYIWFCSWIKNLHKFQVANQLVIYLKMSAIPVVDLSLLLQTFLFYWSCVYKYIICHAWVSALPPKNYADFCYIRKVSPPPPANNNPLLRYSTSFS